MNNIMNNREKAKQLLQRAKSNLIRGKESSYMDLREIALEDLCFDLQQAGEKALKALLTWYGIDFPYTHKLNILIDMLEENSVNVPDFVSNAVILNTFAVDARYDNIIHLTSELYKEALNITENLYEWVLAKTKN